MEKPHNTSEVTGDKVDNELGYAEECKIESWNSSEEKHIEQRNNKL